MFIDARGLPADGLVECDVAIVGTGPAGVATALGLLDAGLRICVLEAGGLSREPESDSASEVEFTGLPVPLRSRERYFGGTSNTWWGKMATLDEVDIGPRPWVSLPGWPIEPSELSRHYRRACQVLEMPDLTEVTSAPRRGRGRSLLDSEDLSTKVFFWWRRAPNFGDLYRRVAGRREDIQTFLHANVTELLLDDAGKRVAALRVATEPGRQVSVRPRAVVLASGGIENPRLLLASRSRLPEGIGNRHDQVGRYFMDHPREVAGWVTARPETAGRLARAYWAGSRLGSGRIRLGVRLSDRAQERLGVLNSYVLLDPVYAGSQGRGPEAVRSVYRRGPGALVDPRVLGNLVAGAPGIARYLSFKALGMGRITAMRVQNFMEQAPRPDNRIRLSERRDGYGTPLPVVDWTIGDLDRKTMRSLHLALAHGLEQRGLGRLRSPILEEDGEWPISGAAAHHMGTTRMGTDRRTSVVDPECRVHGMENLYVAGSSVFPAGGYANPTLTIVALALRLADRLRSSPAP